MTRQNFEGQTVLIGSAFALEVAAGLLLQRPAKRLYERARIGRWHREYERTVTYDANLPDQLERREPAPRPGLEAEGLRKNEAPVVTRLRSSLRP